MLAAQTPQAIPGGYSLPNGWKITPLGKSLETSDMVLNATAAPDGLAVIAMHAGYNPHGLVVVDTKTEEIVQRIPLKSAWFGLAWSPDGKRLFVSGGNANGEKGKTKTSAPIYVFDYANGRLSNEPVARLEETIDTSQLFWSGVAHHPKKNIVYAANRGTGFGTGNVVAFDATTGKMLAHIPVDMIPYDIVPSEDGKTLFVSNLASKSVSVIDTGAMKVVGSIAVGDNPNQMVLGSEGLLYVACSNDNSVVVIDTKTRTAVEKISTTLHPHAPEGSTPNALAFDRANSLLYVANADNNDIAVIHAAGRGKNEVVGFIPSGWYPSALAYLPKQQKLYIGNSKGSGSYSDINGPTSPLAQGQRDSIKSLQRGSVEIVNVANLRSEIKQLTKKVAENTPYNDSLLAQAKEPSAPSIVPSSVGAGSPIKHILYIIKENRTYDQVFGDMSRGNGDARLTIFGRKVTPNQHTLADQYVLLDNLYCDGEVSEDGHSWSNAAYATDANEKQWPITYGGHSSSDRNFAYQPSAGNLWDIAKRKGLTYRSYGEYATRVSDGTRFENSPNAPGLAGHVAPNYKRFGARDTENAAEIIKEFDEYEKNYDSKDPNKRLPNFMVMALSENHTNGTRPGSYTPVAMVASNDLGVGLIVERVSHSKYWPETAIFIIEDDAQDGPDHVDAHRTAGLVISPYVKREKVDSTLYSTSSMLRTMELLLGLPPMSQYDAAATPMYMTFGTNPDLTPFNHVNAEVDLNAKNTQRAWGARESKKMDFDDVDRNAPGLLNEIIWRSVKGADSPMPLPVHSYQFK